MLTVSRADTLLASVPGDVVARLRVLDLAAGSEALYHDQVPELLISLALRARVESITASSAIEGVTAEPRRSRQIIEGRQLSLRTRDEQELAGYRDALDYLFAGDWRPLNVGLILHLHRLLWARTNTPGGRFKSDDNLVVDRTPDGSMTVRFRPVAASQTQHYTSQLVDDYLHASALGQHHPILLVGLLILDLTVIHPFDDGNGRVARALTNAVLEDAGYRVGRWVSLEQVIAETADDYYGSLLASTHGWHEGHADVWPWLRYFVGIVATAYGRFSRRVRAERAQGTKQDRVREYVLNRASAVFRIDDIRAALPGISDNTIRLVLTDLKAKGSVISDGTGRSATWRKSG
jgi:Fic family protein